MIIVKDSRNCLFNAARPVTDTAWLKLHEKDSRHCRHAASTFTLPSVSPRFLKIFFTVLSRAAHIDSDGGHKTEANGRGLADKMKGGRKKRGGSMRERSDF